MIGIVKSWIRGRMNVALIHCYLLYHRSQKSHILTTDHHLLDDLGQTQEEPGEAAGLLEPRVGVNIQNTVLVIFCAAIQSWL